MKSTLLQLLCFGFFPFGILDTQTIGANPGFPLNLANHRFSATPAGELAHFVDDQLRATVPAEGWDDYVKYWPASIDVVRQLRAKAATDAAAAHAVRTAKVQAALATLPQGTDPKIASAVTAAVMAALGVDAIPAAAAAATTPDPMQDPSVQAAIAILKGKGIQVTGG